MSRNFGLMAMKQVFRSSTPEVRQKIIITYTVLIGYNILAWLLVLLLFKGNSYLLLLAFTAYTFGVRHAFDADHISAIDNVTRKFMQEKQQPVAIGLFFSLGHSTIVVVLTIIIALTAVAAKNFSGLEAIGGLIGTLVSSIFLFLIALINIVVLIDLYQVFHRVKHGGRYEDADLNEILNRRGLIGRFFQPLLKMTDRSWKMYPVGALFGLGFDTATEIGLLGIAAATAGKGFPIAAILIFPALFTAGMTLMDTTDSILMLGAYGWAFVKPIRKLYYNLNITLLSVIVALVVGGLEGLNIVATELNLSGPAWNQIGDMNDHFGIVGIVIVALFLLCWGISTVIYKIKRYDDIDKPF